MTKNEIESILDKILEEEGMQLDSPTSGDWDVLRIKFNCEFGDEFKSFIELMSTYIFPGDIFNVSTGRTNGNDSIELVYDFEMKGGNWNPKMMPFYGIGNGDYFCLNSDENPSSPVYYYYHEDSRVEKYADTFEEWIRDLPDFLE
ncbi:SMI1/KNR4 family protein [Pelosinus baikalensis]|uniref:SMI1/KNR4 family protein n=1 Tax=Pelosinus baikalensis TaxID=2892015 RepID=A0ABS8HKS0_9FIRM|nr:SMI1/KNR4 family protein [Pelosinus baikalensis]MCC5463776.1 SMI1/KNR4 family protein [Pelosinus baikalensis]